MRHFSHTLLVAALMVAAPASAQFYVHPTFNAAINGGPMSMALQVGNVGSNGKICGQSYEDDIQKERLLALQAAGKCGKSGASSSLIAKAAPNTNGVPASARQLSYKPSQANRRANYANIVAKTRRTDPAGAAKMQELFASTDVVAQIDQAIRPSGLRADNVADAYAVWWITAWEAVHQRDMGSSARMSQAVKNQAANALLSTPQFASTTNAQKQEMAEAFLIQAALIDASEEVFARDPAQLKALSKAVNQGAMAMAPDLDLTKMTLTQDGFVPRSGGRSDAGDAAGDDSQLAANNGAQADGANMGDYALYAVAGTGLLAGMFALGKGFSKKG